jgi:cysteinyl-tRNA synthetase
MSLHLYNTLSRELERFKPLRQDEVKIYYCGPTPYNYAHIGNLRAYLFSDFVIRTLRFLGYKVRTVMNITDIDDKTIRDSQKSGKSLKEFTEFYANEFLSDLTKLHINHADTISPISELIPDMGKMIQWLLDKGYAYLADDGSIYYSVSKFKKYGQLANLDMKWMISSVRIDNDEYEKDQVADFALWKAYDKETDGENFWKIKLRVKSEKWKVTNNNTTPCVKTSQIWSNSSENREPQWVVSGNTTNEESEIWTWSTSISEVLLKGRPGWHIECSACNMRFFGAQIDIHMGGIDNLFPHHQNEVAQTEAFTGKTFSKYWMHGGHLLVDNKKMAKSAWNFFTLRDIIEKYSNEVKTSQTGNISEAIISRWFRLMALQNQYRENFNFTFDRLGAAINTIKGLDEMMKRIGRYMDGLPESNDERSARGKLKFHEISRDFRENQQVFMQEFVDRLENDFDTNSAMTVIFEYQSYINRGIDEQAFRMEEMKSIIDLLRSWNEVISILDFSLLESIEIIPKEIEALAVARIEAKNTKNWWEADKIRDEITSLWWKMIDEASGKWRVEKM